MPVYHFLRFLVSIFAPLLWRVKIHGRHNIPKRGPLIIAANHIHALDPLPLALTTRRPISFLAKEEMFTWPVVGWLATNAGSFPVKRGRTDVQAVRSCLKVLQAGGVLGIFPEGTRSKTGEIQEALSGAALFAARTGAPIVPVAIDASYRFRGLVKVNVGEPIHVTSLQPGKPTAEERALGTATLMRRISELLQQCKEERW